MSSSTTDIRRTGDSIMETGDRFGGGLLQDLFGFNSATDLVVFLIGVVMIVPMLLSDLLAVKLAWTLEKILGWATFGLLDPDEHGFPRSANDSLRFLYNVGIVLCVIGLPLLIVGVGQAYAIALLLFWGMTVLLRPYSNEY